MGGFSVTLGSRGFGKGNGIDVYRKGVWLARWLEVFAALRSTCSPVHTPSFEVRAYLPHGRGRVWDEYRNFGMYIESPRAVRLPVPRLSVDGISS